MYVCVRVRARAEACVLILINQQELIEARMALSLKSTRGPRGLSGCGWRRADSACGTLRLACSGQARCPPTSPRPTSPPPPRAARGSVRGGAEAGVHRASRPPPPPPLFLIFFVCFFSF